VGRKGKRRKAIKKKMRAHGDDGSGMKTIVKYPRSKREIVGEQFDKVGLQFKCAQDLVSFDNVKKSRSVSTFLRR